MDELLAMSTPGAASVAQEVPDAAGVLDHDEDFEPTFQDIAIANIGATDIGRMKEAGIFSIKKLMQMPTKKLQQIRGFSEAKVEKIKAAAEKIMPMGFVTASIERERRQREVYRLSTGSSEVDTLLRGGFESQSMTEIHGVSGSGKTQMCHTLLPRPDTNYPGGKVVFLDTEGTFRPERLKPICERFGLDYDEALENIFYMRIQNSEHQVSVISKLAELVFDQGGLVRLIIIDSIIALFRVDYSGRGELAERQQCLAQCLHAIHQLAEERNISVVMTNQMTADPGGGLTFVPDPKKAVGGNILSHGVQTRLYFRNGRGGDKVAKIVDSPVLPLGEATFSITDQGVGDSGG